MERLKFHFMNPFQKWSYAKRRRFPWKLLVQIVSIFLVTLQVCVCVCVRARAQKAGIFLNFVM